MIVVSACLAGLHCRYDGGGKPNETVVRLVAEGKALPICPEQLGGLPTPRLPAEIKSNRVFRKDGLDLTPEFNRGADEAYKIVQLTGARKVILKSRSPSCGSGEIYDGSFSGRIIPGDGIFAAVCKQNGIEVLTEEDFE